MLALPAARERGGAVEAGGRGGGAGGIGSPVGEVIGDVVPVLGAGELDEDGSLSVGVVGVGVGVGES